MKVVPQEEEEQTKRGLNFENPTRPELDSRRHDNISTGENTKRTRERFYVFGPPKWPQN